ncbi:MAG: PLD nuclease N-terminal domain-containing protein [Rhodothermales bacterium]
MPLIRRFQTAAPLAVLSLLALLLAGCAGGNLIELIGRPWAWGPCTLIIVILDIVALVGLWQSGRSTGDKVLWTLLIVFFPVGGLILYYLFA